MRSLGADPRAETWGKFADDEPNTALLEAARYGRLDLIKRFKVDPKRDDLIELIAAPADYLDRATLAFEADPQIEESIEYLIGFRPDLGQPTRSGRSMMDAFFLQMELESSGGFYP